MKITTREKSALLTLALGLSMSGCPDPAPAKIVGEGGAEGGDVVIGGTESSGTEASGTEASGTEAGVEAIDMTAPDMELPDMELDMAVPDMELDMMAPDMEPVIPPYEGAECVESETCGPQEACAYGLCRFELRPNVFRMIGGEVFEPAGGTGQLLEVLLNNSVQSEMLNLMFEPGFYMEDGQAYWFIGNGLPSPEGYVYRRNFPIQNFVGSWLNAPQEGGSSAPMWRLEGQRPFILAVPTGVVTPADTATYGELFQCTTTFPTTVNVTITPERDGEDGPYSRIKVETQGYLKRADIEQIRILFNGSEINFIDYFNNVELLDLDGDGEAQEYAFHLVVQAAPINFLEELARPDRLDLRDPSPMVTQPPECEVP
jgi:hypothetical protein